MPHVIERTTLEEIKTAAPRTIWFSVGTCWWTHQAKDLHQHGDNPGGLPCDPRGGMLMMADANAFLVAAEANPLFYGEHGLGAFIAAHNDNCVVSLADRRPSCLRTWKEYNDLLGGK